MKVRRKICYGLREGVLYTKVKHVYTLGAELVIETEGDGKFLVASDGILFNDILRDDMHEYLGLLDRVGIRYRYITLDGKRIRQATGLITNKKITYIVHGEGL